ncbi:Mucin-associated surface protein (MASP) [Trypanosoma cruzi]|uniref:Mucin-associated surface protein (MASP), putative n=2 Tax=Trypanosoma cruzi TaxID=5693 RepID=Q4CPH3_TRYCC|nr:mucin-associated surface protein (MASP), putative [Trypanosoma cruzi]EAN82174.1 mucin-associated surface protein (MASP), putative [Trypanosoma cruzi]PWV19975.1 Mucin-associated surface protein (MASP) [Trypanosoma cruzi]|eukprot:XP_804025.1 mucin-associated surface protein (MASP) [Trypanosoma cruzi strain CL Brener]
MAMMMTGRVLLVCALCVLWCGAGGGCEEVPGVSTSGVSGDIEREGGDSQDSSRSEPPGPKKPAPETPAPKVQQQEVISPPPKDPPAETEDGAGGDEEGKAREEGAKDAGKENRGGATSKEVKKPENHLTSVKDPQSRDNEGLQSPSLNGTHGVGTITTSLSGSLTVNTNQQDLSSPLQPPLPNSSPHAIPSSTSAAGPDNEKRHENVNGTKNSQLPVVGDIQEKNGTGVKAVASTGGGEDPRLTVTTLEEMGDATKKGDSNSSTAATAALRSETGTEGIPTTNHPNRPSTEGATSPEKTSDGEAASANKYDTVPQSAGSTTAPTTNAKTGETTPVDSDGSTAVSHTTSPLLLLVVAAAASVVTA